VHLDRSTATGPAWVMPGPVAVCNGTDAPHPYYQDQAFALYQGDSDGTRGRVPLLSQFTERFDVEQAVKRLGQGALVFGGALVAAGVMP
jgi:hypothetical protein